MSPPDASADDYARAERFLLWNKERYTVNADIQHHWIGDEDRFWYLRTSKTGQKELVVVDAATGAQTCISNAQKIAAVLSEMTGTRIARPSVNPDEVQSPDGKWAVSLRQYNVWLRPTAGGAAFALTTDGVEHYGYAGTPGDSRRPITDIRQGRSTPPEVIWSPDSRHLLTHRLDERNVKDLFLMQSVPGDGSVRPKLFAHRYALPGDEHVPLVEPVVLEIATRRETRIATKPLNEFMMTPIAARNMWWSADSATIYYLNMDRFSKSISLNAADPHTGKVREILRETSQTFLLPADGGLHNNPSVKVLSNGDVIWYSERDGWGHLYYYEAMGTLRNQITRGEWVVRGIARVDEAAGRIYFIASGREEGRDPYYQHLYGIGMDGSGLRLLTPQDAEHQIDTSENPLQSSAVNADTHSTGTETHAFSPSGRYFVHSYSRPDKPSVLALRDAEGQLIRELEAADISALKTGGHTPIEPFQVLAADGKTPIYGNIFRPSTFNPDRKYPVIDSIYPGPQGSRTPKSFSAATFDLYGASALAEVGFIVVTVDGRGTPHRSKAFLDDCYGQMGKAGNLEDRIAAIRQLAQRYPYMDLDRVGISGVSGGGYAAARALLTYPEFYKVAVAAEGNHDQRAYCASWGETYNGPLGEADYQGSANQSLAANLKGKLFLMHGEMDDNVSPAQTLKLADALIKANKDFDLLIIPNGNHEIYKSPYFIRRQWNYFVRHLLGAEPPAQYVIGTGLCP